MSMKKLLITKWKRILPLVAIILLLAIVAIPQAVPKAIQTNILRTVSAAGIADYALTGTNDNAIFQLALNDLPTTGGTLQVVSTGTIDWANGVTVTRAIDNVVIQGAGTGTLFDGDGVTPIFTAGGDYWAFKDLSTDAGRVAFGVTFGGSMTNVLLDVDYYAYQGSLFDGDVGDFTYLSSTELTAPTGRGATYIVAASNASDQSKAQADYICDATDDYVQFQAAFDAIKALGYGNVKFLEGDYHLGATGATLLFDDGTNLDNPISIDFSGARIYYSGTGAALHLGHATANKFWRGLSIRAGHIIAEGGALASATANGLKLQQLVNPIISGPLCINEFRLGMGIYFAQANFNNTSPIIETLYTVNTKIGIYSDGSCSHLQVRYLYWDSTSSVNVLNGRALKIEGTANGNPRIDYIMMLVVNSGAVGIESAADGGWIGTFHLETFTSGEGGSGAEDFIAIKLTGAYTVPLKIDTFQVGRSPHPGRAILDGTSTRDIEIGRFVGAYLDGGLSSAGAAQVRMVGQPSGKNKQVNGEFLVSTSGWTKTAGNNPTLEAIGRNGSNNCISFVAVAAATEYNIHSDNFFRVVANQPVFAELWTKSDVNDAEITAFRIRWYTDVLGYISFSDAYPQEIDSGADWKYVWLYATAPTNAVYGKIQYIYRMPDNTSKIYFDDFTAYVPDFTFDENHGTATLLNGNTSVIVTHGLGFTPTVINITWLENPTNPIGDWWVDTIGAASFTLNGVDPGASNLDFYWEAKVR